MTQLPFTDQKPIFMKMEEVASYSQMDPEQQRIYMDSLNRYRTAVAVKKYDYDRGLAEGIEKGLAEGIEKGIEKGKVEIAKNLLAKNMPVDAIIDVTGLTKEVVEGLRMQS